VKIQRQVRFGKKDGNWDGGPLFGGGCASTASVSFYFSAFVSHHGATRARPRDGIGAGHVRRGSPVVQIPLRTVAQFSLPMFSKRTRVRTAARLSFWRAIGLRPVSDGRAKRCWSSAAAAGHPSSVAACGPRSGSEFRDSDALEGASSSARVRTSPFAGQEQLFIGNDPSQWRRNIPQFGRVEYSAVVSGHRSGVLRRSGTTGVDFRWRRAAIQKQIALSFQGASARIDAGLLEI